MIKLCIYPFNFVSIIINTLHVACMSWELEYYTQTLANLVNSIYIIYIHTLIIFHMLLLVKWNDFIFKKINSHSWISIYKIFLHNYCLIINTFFWIKNITLVSFYKFWISSFLTNVILHFKFWHMVIIYSIRSSVLIENEKSLFLVHEWKES